MDANANTPLIARRRRTATIQRAATLMLGVACVACGNSNEPVPIVFSTVVYGVVTSGAGGPLVGVQIESETYRGTCASGAKTGGSSPVLTTTDDAGRFRQQIVTSDSASQQCLRVTARPPNGTPRVAEISELSLKVAADASLPYDSVRVNVTIP